MQTQKNLEVRFHDDIDQIAMNLIQAYGLRYEEEAEDLSEPLLRWQDFVFRYITPKPRAIIISNKFPMALDTETQKKFEHFESLIRSGADLNPYQSKGLILHNDTSLKKRQLRTDLLWADWGIHHLHLAPKSTTVTKYFSDRSKWLLFCIVGDDFIGLIDIIGHDDPELFSNPDLMRTVFESWPRIMDRYRMNSILPANIAPSATEIAGLRKSGISSPLTINNKTYMPIGMGVSTASTSTRVTIAINKIRKNIRELAKLVENPEGQFKTESTKSGVIDPEYSIVLTPRGLAVYEKHENKAFVLPRVTKPDEENFITELHDLVAPQWAIDFMTKKNQTINNPRWELSTNFADYTLLSEWLLKTEISPSPN